MNFKQPKYNVGDKVVLYSGVIGTVHTVATNSKDPIIYEYKVETKYNVYWYQENEIKDHHEPHTVNTK